MSAEQNSVEQGPLCTTTLIFGVRVTMPSPVMISLSFGAHKCHHHSNYTCFKDLKISFSYISSNLGMFFMLLSFMPPPALVSCHTLE